MIPRPADVISYAYLWAREAARGQAEGLKDRPSVVVVARIARADRHEIVVAPITHSPPEKPGDAIELPANVKRVLGLDQERSWMVTTELNRFLWPGPDIRVASGRDTPLYDALPEVLFDKLRAALAQHVATGRMKVTKRGN
jgi:hypothetical protein